MARKRALIVDDSKSARVILSRMLEKYDIEVDLAESAEQSIEYLKGNRPDAIFMDHLMPGMDGLQAVQAIKSNPRTAMIPIMMYTSQEGELYVGQARALGAMGVLPKQVRPVDVSKVLYELHLLPDRRDTDEPALAPVELVTTATSVHVAPAAPHAAPAAPGADWGRRVEAAIKDQGADLRRFIVASLDSFASRIVIDVRDSPPSVKPTAEPLPQPAATPPPAPKSAGPWIAGIAAAGFAALLFAVLWFQARDEVAKSQTELAGLAATNTELARAREDLTETIKDLTSALAAAPASGGLPAAGAAIATPPWARTELVPYGEAPLDRARVDVLREVLGKLEAQGFHGIVKVTSYAGAYCLSGNTTDGYQPANAALPIVKCDVIGNPAEEASAGLQRQSLAFANLIGSIRQRSSGAISVTTENAGNARLAVPYPVRSDSMTAGEWNKAAAANNRVEYLAQPGVGAP